MSRKTVWIPLVPLVAPDDGPARGVVLELWIEPGGHGARTDESLRRLRGHGLGVALSAARAALAGAELPPLAGGRTREPPVWQVANPDPRLSNAAGAALGIALGWLLYEGRCPGQRLIASGRFLPPAPRGGATLAPDPRLADKLRAVLTFGPQAAPLPFLVPARGTGEVETVRSCAALIAALATHNIRVAPVASLEEAVAACWRCERELRATHPSEKPAPP